MDATTLNTIVGIIGIVVGVIGVIVGIITFADGVEILTSIIISVFIGILTGTIFGILVGAVFAKPLSYIPEYKVILSDDISMNEFMDKYEIIDQERRIYTVRERGEE